MWRQFSSAAVSLRAAPAALWACDLCRQKNCAACLDAVTATPAPGCPVCRVSLNSEAISVVDIALGELAEAMLQEEAAPATSLLVGAASPADSVNTEPSKRHKSEASSSITYGPDTLDMLALMCSAAKGLVEHKLPRLVVPSIRHQ